MEDKLFDYLMYYYFLNKSEEDSGISFQAIYTMGAVAQSLQLGRNPKLILEFENHTITLGYNASIKTIRENCREVIYKHRYLGK